VLLSAGLANRRPKSEIITVYAKAAQFQSAYKMLDQQLATESDRIGISELDDLLRTLSIAQPGDLVIATAHHGHFVAFLCALARAGVPLAACYRSASRAYIDALGRSGVALVDLDAMSSVRRIFDAFDELRADGRYIVLMIDAPFASRRNYPFLGYQVAVSSMPWLYARHSRAALLPLASRVESTTLLGYTRGDIVTPSASDCTQTLLGFLEEVILGQPEQYAWSNSILLSDLSARERAFSFALEALEWRRTILHHT
jgi:lauroyl/myristoyl acyltransferase